MAGGVFGFVVACRFGGLGDGMLGSFVGAIYASIVGVPTIGAVALVSWCFWLSRFRVAMGVLAGGLTGIVATLSIGPSPPGDYWVDLAMAGFLGTLGGGLAGRLYHSPSKSQALHQISRQQPWRFTLRDLFIRVTVISAVLAACVFVGNLLHVGRQNARRDECKYNLISIRRCLDSYHEKHGVLPPAYVADENGHPLLSWRVLAAEYVYLGYDFKTKMDFTKPWNSPTNSRFLNSISTEWLQCPSSWVTKPNVTHYVAVVGPGTLWEQPCRLSGSDKRILVIEWPNSDIHWSEPRDITVDELLDWLKSKPDTNHPGCLQYVDGSGEVGELRTDSDPETVRTLLIGQPPKTP